jgi:hypothetical protein
MAPIEQYRMTSPAEEIALAKSAAPPSVSDKASVEVLSSSGYKTAVTGTNGFVCIVERAWANDFNSPDFWNPKVRAPICFNEAAAQSVLPVYLKRTEWVLAGLSHDEIGKRNHAAFGHRTPKVGAMCYMQSKDGYLGDNVSGPWHPHLMYFLPRTEAEKWGAGLPGSPIYAFNPSPQSEPVTVFFTPVPRWSDGGLDDQLTAGEHRHGG